MGKRSYVLPLLLVVLTAGIALRFYNYSVWSLSNDELSAMARLQFPDFRTMIREGVMLNDMHPPGVQVFLWYWTHIFGTAQWLYRLPFVIAGCLSVWVFYLTGRRWFGEAAALVATAIFAACSYLVLYSQLARPYSPGLLFSLLFVYALTQVVIDAKGSSSKSWWILLVLAGAACMYTHYFSFMFAGIAGAGSLLFIRSRTQLRNLVLATVVMFILYIPALPVAIHQFSIGGLGGPEGWLGPPKSDAIFQYILYAFNSSFVLLFLLLAIMLSGIRNWNDGNNRLRIYSLILFILPVLIAYCYSIWKNPVFQYSILIFGFPYLILLVTSGIKSTKPVIIISLTVFTLLITASTMIFQQRFYSVAQFAVFKEIAIKTNEYSKKYGSENIIRTINVISPYYIHYYLDDIAPGMKYDLYDQREAASLRALDSLAKNSGKEYFLHGWSNTWHGAETEQIIRSYYPYRVQRDSFFNAGLVVYGKSGKPSELIKFLLDTVNTFESNLWNNDVHLRAENVAFEGNASMRLTPENEFGSGVDLRTGDYRIQQGNTIECDVWINTEKLNKDAMIVMSLENAEQQSITWRSRTLTDFVIPGKGWQRVYYAYRLAEDIQPDDRIKIYIWNSGKNSFNADNMRIRVW